MKKLLFQIISILLIPTLTFATTSKTVYEGGVSLIEWDVSSSVVAFYKFEDNAANTTVTDSQGAINCTASANTSTYSTTGKINLGFNSFTTNNNVDCGSSSSFKPAGAFTVAFYIKPAGTGTQRRILGNRSAAGNNDGFEFIWGTGSTVTFQIDTGATVNSQITTSTLSVGTWYLVVGGRDASNNTFLYLNNASEGTPVNNPGTLASAQNLYIGCTPLTCGTSAVRWDGNIDNFLFLNRAATSAEVIGIYAEAIGTDSLSGSYNSATQSIWVMGSSATVQTNRGLTNNQDVLVQDQFEVNGNAYFDGNVGVGSSYPGAAVDVIGTVRASTALKVGTLNTCLSDGTNCPALAAGQWKTQSSIGIGTINNVGIGTYTWGSQLTVLGGVGIGTSGSSLYIQNAAGSGNLLVEKNVGIGSLTPGQNLDVQGTIRSSSNMIVNNQNVCRQDGTNCPAGSTNYWGAGSIGVGTYSNIGIGTINPQDRLIVLDGNIGVGTITARSAIDIIGSGRLTTNIGIGTTAPTAAIDVGNGAFKVTSTGVITGSIAPSNFTGGTSAKMFVANSGGTYIGVVLTGDVTVGSTAVSAIGVGKVLPTMTNFSTGGNIGIGTVASAALLTIKGNVGIGTVANDVYLTTSPPLGGQIIYGNLGIGTYLPSARININGSGGSFISQQTTAPTVASNDCGSTSQGTVVSKSTDLSGTVTVGTLAVTSCAVTFNGTFNAAPNCICMDDSNVLAVRCTATTTKLTVVSTASMSNDLITWWCPGNS